MWSWLDRLGDAHLALPGGFVIAMLAMLCTTSDTSDGQLLLVLPGLVMLAAVGLPTLRRGGANAFDWFSLLLYSIAAILIWFAWFTKMTGAPAGFARSLARLTPGATYEFRWIPFVFGIAATVAWLAVVRWRIVSHPKVLWRSVVLASGGLILAWTLTSTLFLETIDYSRTYRDVSTSLVGALNAARDEALRGRRGRIEPSSKSDAKSDARGDARGDAMRAASPGGSCVATDGLGLAQRASFAWFDGIRFSRVDDDGHNVDECDYLLRQDLARTPRDEGLPGGRWKLLWEGRRPADRDERFRLFRKLGAATTRGASDAIDRNDGRDAKRDPTAVPVTPTVDPVDAQPSAPAPASRKPGDPARRTR